MAPRATAIVTAAWLLSTGQLASAQAAPPAPAQSALEQAAPEQAALPHTRGFVEVRLLADHDMVWAPTRRDEGVADAWAPGVGLVAGVFFAPAWSVRVEAELPQWHVDRWIQPVYVVQPNGSWKMTGTEVVERRRRAPACSGLAAWHGARGSRVDVALLVGVSLMPKSDGFTWLAIPLGAEAAIRIIRNVSIVPEARIYLFPGPTDTAQMISRIGIGLRYTF